MIFCEAEYSAEERFDGLCSPIPPSLAGMANSSLSVSLGGGLPVWQSFKDGGIA